MHVRRTGARAQASGSTIFVISRLGPRENARYNYRRLHNALYRLTEYYGNPPRAKVVGAVGDRTTSTGVVEVYLAGKLSYVVSFRPNRDFTVDCCPLPDEPPPREYFPYYRGRPKYRFS